MTPKIIVGDVHGSAEHLLRLVEELRANGRPILFLGDYVNRGNSSRIVIETLIQLQKQQAGVSFLCGNHDWAFLQYIKRGSSDEFLRLGGLQTLASYIPEFAFGNVRDLLLSRIPEAHVHFFENLLPYFEDQDLVCCHTGIAPERPEDRSFSEMVMKPHISLFKSYLPSRKLVVCGHYVQMNLVPFQSYNFVCLDTGCGTVPNGRLTALFLPENRFLQIDHLGQRLWVESVRVPS